jgi:hypothetical protein
MLITMESKNADMFLGCLIKLINPDFTIIYDASRLQNERF